MGIVITFDLSFLCGGVVFLAEQEGVFFSGLEVHLFQGLEWRGMRIL